jgi:hypothetical protein
LRLTQQFSVKRGKILRNPIMAPARGTQDKEGKVVAVRPD